MKDFSIDWNDIENIMFKQILIFKQIKGTYYKVTQYTKTYLY